MSLIEKYKGQIENELNDPTNDKYELTDATMEYCGHTLHRIRALRDIRLVTGDTLRAGSLGGWVEHDWNLSYTGECWVHNDAMVIGGACVGGDALIMHNTIVKDNASVREKAIIQGESEISGFACVSGTAYVLNDCCIRSHITDFGIVCDDATVKGGTLSYGLRT